MVEYVPPPSDLSRLNVVQRYMQKGSLDWSDYGWLIALVLIYWFSRPYIQRFVKATADPAVREGEFEQEAFQQRRAKAAIDANQIRSGKQRKEQDSKTLGQLLDEGPSAMMEGSAATTSAATVPEGDVINRSIPVKKKKGVSFAPEKSEEERTMDWEDESKWDPNKVVDVVPGAKPGEVVSGNVLDWIKTWDQ